MCNLYSITTNQAAVIALFRAVNHNVGNLPPMPGVFPDYPAPVVRNAGTERELTMMRWGMPPPPRTGGPPVTNIRNTSSPRRGRGGPGRPHLHRAGGGTPGQYRAALDRAITLGWLWRHEPGTYVKFTPAGAELFA
jgi:hypothetical protein